ncbi:alpha/beta hydrolase [Pseudonocardia kujensis]|uniref:alpha/beta fold hydrolase n=1 Tax=Pseudonocardia kujensis TaxID=1128675 RepID=UPI001E47B0C0|nr:alpha/beta hydrolase [Pseudonocardia kujensis]MCE0766568.1 alpha/beta hydrolase [Pseudonocardia kujensis]
MAEANDPGSAGRVAGGERVVFDGAAGKLVGDRWPAVGERRGPALLLHGGGQTRHSWFRTAAALAEAGWEAIALDARGHGDSDWAPDGDYGTDALNADLLAVAEQVGEPALLLGASMGGMTALVTEGEHGGVARALVLVDIVPKVEPDGVARIMAFMGANPDGFGSLEEVAEAVRAYNPHRKRPPNPEGLRKNVRLGENGRWYWHWDPAFLRVGDEPRRSATHERAAAAAARVTVPTLLVRGAQSDIVSSDGVQELLELIPGAVHVDVSATGHMVAGDDNDVFTGTVLGFLADHQV